MGVTGVGKLIPGSLKYRSFEDFSAASVSARLENRPIIFFIPSLPSENLGSKLLLADNWNEYGEGHWINPGSLCGFGYLDAMRNTFAAASSHADAIPTDSQKLRIDSYFPKT